MLTQDEFRWAGVHKKIAAALACLLLPGIALSGVLSLAAPVRLLDATMYKDGGTKSALMADAKGASFSFCLDGRLSSATVEQKRHVYLNALHPTYPNARRIDIGSAEEQRLVVLLRQWKQENIPPGTCEDRQKTDNSADNLANWKKCLVVDILGTLEQRNRR